jgi:hypothetical protein
MQTAVMLSTASRDVIVVNVSIRIITKTTTRKDPPQKTKVLTIVSVNVRLEDAITRGNNCRERYHTNLLVRQNARHSQVG